jgi:hypothetical protein
MPIGPTRLARSGKETVNRPFARALDAAGGDRPPPPMSATDRQRYAVEQLLEAQATPGQAPSLPRRDAAVAGIRC